MFAEDIILQPVLTEKGYDGIASKRYTFIVKKDANKTEIKAAVEKLFGVKVAGVNTLTCKKGQKRGLHARPQEGDCHSERGQQAHRILRVVVVIRGGRKHGSQNI